MIGSKLLCWEYHFLDTPRRVVENITLPHMSACITRESRISLMPSYIFTHSSPQYVSRLFLAFSLPSYSATSYWCIWCLPTGLVDVISQWCMTASRFFSMPLRLRSFLPLSAAAHYRRVQYALPQYWERIFDKYRFAIKDMIFDASGKSRKTSYILNIYWMAFRAKAISCFVYFHVDICFSVIHIYYCSLI